MNALKTVYTRLTTMKPAMNAVKNAGVDIRDNNGAIRDTTDILGDLAGKWDTLSSEQQQHTAVAAAGRYQVSR